MVGGRFTKQYSVQSITVGGPAPSDRISALNYY